MYERANPDHTHGGVSQFSFDCFPPREHNYYLEGFLVNFVNVRIFRFIKILPRERERERESDTLNENNLSIDSLRLLSTGTKKIPKPILYRRLRTSISDEN